jgi:hypothetical protein
MNKFIIILAFLIGLVSVRPHEAQAACGVSVPFIFTTGTSLVSASTTNSNNAFLLGCANNVDNTQIGAAGIFASQIVPNGVGTATFGGSIGYRFAIGAAAQVPLTIIAASAQSADIFDVFNSALTTKYFGINSSGQYYGSVACPPVATTEASGSGTYTTPTCNGITAQYLVVEMVGGGGGGGGSGSQTAPGSNGGNTTFGTTLLTGNGGQVGSNNSTVIGLGGSASGGFVNVSGQSGGPVLISSGNALPGAPGGQTPFGGGVNTASGANGTSASAPGAGGAGGTSAASNGSGGGGGGGAGGYCRAIITAPLATYSYAVGAGGTAQGASNSSGGNGANGIIVIVAHWQ